MSAGKVALGVGMMLTLFAALGAPSYGRENLAAGKPVRTSSVQLGDPAGAVNGFVEWGSYAVHTNADSPAWLVIDLDGTFPVGEVKVWSRADGHHDESGASVTVEVSDDGEAFRPVGTCHGDFSQAAPCSVEVGGALARHVRLVHEGHLVLSEVEVLGAR